MQDHENLNHHEGQKQHPTLAEASAPTTETRNPRSMDLDMLSTQDMLSLINSEDQKVAIAVASQIPEITKAVDIIVDRLKQGGRLFYMGAGTSGRLGILDAAELKPTFGVGKETVEALIAGGPSAITESVEAAEDSFTAGGNGLKERSISAKDVVFGIAASGSTPYVLGGLEVAREAGAATIGLACNSGSKLREYADVVIEVVVGPEVLTGSTRMKAGTAQKMVLNMMSTAVMVKLGKVYENFMVDMQATNAKLRIRANGMIQATTGVDRDEAQRLLNDANHDLKTAIVMGKLNVDATTARERLAKSEGYVRRAITDELK
ncbi:MAG: N-acetylmuramic acid 6-phosphate etherase [Firmicutes bacterium]|nr:N-acetylmuramic acid 6-phosphate etherase [Bacillota bacterium]